jgi:8-oxo-dGTP diphosphatase
LELNLTGPDPKCNSCNIVYYSNSKPTASILPILDGKVLLAKRAQDPFKGSIDIIGGFLHDGEKPEDGARREAKEETGLTIEIVELLGIYTDKYGDEGINTININYVGKITGGEMIAQDDVESLHWFPIDELPQNIGFESSRQTLLDLKPGTKKYWTPHRDNNHQLFHSLVPLDFSASEIANLIISIFSSSLISFLFFSIALNFSSVVPVISSNANKGLILSHPLAWSSLVSPIDSLKV